ncbi:lipopolysaccharide export system permease protein [Natronospira proteinivora]|uniref:Lipopolysaccharide export system permease protein n=1 Tax=Natronospira proteinivora TaxID=1807133 RepID=A0ABT1G4H7_9GAMM|nr:LPS export ABC transporter permease LptG [Natronospira proteinivora]MCP1726194.1 lipopolysaccharide export system permease protein [Natronospira proteinivora]
MKILDRYLALAVIAGSLMVLAVLMALTLFVGVVGQFGNLGTGDYGLSEAVSYVLLGLPGQAVDLMPVAVLIGTLLGLGTLASQNELTVMRAAGMPIARVARGALYGGVLLALGCAVLAEWVAPPAERHADHMRATALYENVNILGRSGAWLRDGEQFINARQAREASHLEGLYLYEFDDDNRLIRAAHARQARFEDGQWQLESVSETRLGLEEVRADQQDQEDWETGIGPALLTLVSVSPDMLSARGLWQYIQYLESSNLDADQYRVAFWFKLVIPAALPVMVLLAMPFLFGSLRSSGAGQRLMVGLVIGIAFYLVNITLANVGAIVPLAPFFVAWLPTLTLLLVSVLVLRRL